MQIEELKALIFDRVTEAISAHEARNQAQTGQGSNSIHKQQRKFKPTKNRTPLNQVRKNQEL